MRHTRAAIVPETHGIQVGADLSGVITKPVIVAGGGVIVRMGSRSFVDVGVSYTRINARPSRIPYDEALDVVRLQAGVGIRF
jgi:hypothetical protein